MCIIMYKPEGKCLKAQHIKACFDSNRDGAGYMYAKDNSVHIKKGFMTFESLMEDLRKTIKEMGGSSKKFPMILHFRIGTQGGRVPEMTHPYPVCRDYDQMKVLDNKCEIAMCHNGILRDFSNYYVKDHNDSMEFIHDFAVDVINGDIHFNKKPNKVRLLTNFSTGSRLAFMTREGEVSLYGDWVEFDGCKYSHNSAFMVKPAIPYKPKKIKAKDILDIKTLPPAAASRPVGFYTPKTNSSSLDADLTNFLKGVDDD